MNFRHIRNWLTVLATEKLFCKPARSRPRQARLEVELLEERRVFSATGMLPTVMLVPPIADPVPISTAPATSPLVLTGEQATLSATAGSAFQGAVASLTDSDASAQAGDFTATIDWGDGQTSAGTVVANSQGGFDVVGNHTYTSAQYYGITVDVSAAGNTAEAYSSLSVAAGVVAQIQLTATTDSAPGALVSVTATAADAYGNSVSNYTGTIHFTSSDSLAGLPPDYTFAAADNGSQTFTVSLQTVGSQTVTATDTSDGSIVGQTTVVVHSDVAPTLTLTADPNGATAGMPTTFTVTAVDQFGNQLPSYTGTVHFTSSDSLAVLPSDYTFTTADNGSQTFTATMLEPGSPTITATDTSTGSITGATSVWVSTATPNQVAYPNDGSTVVSEAVPATGGGQAFALISYNADGTLNTSFGNGGEVSLSGLSGPNDTAPAIAVQANGQIVVAGSAPSANGLQFVVLRYNADGTPDMTFGNGGMVTTSFAGADAQAVGVLVQSNGQIVVAGTVRSGSGGEFGLARYNTDGSLDTSFGTGGLVTTAFSGDASVSTVSQVYNGEIFVSGQTADGSYIEAYYNSDGSQDLSGPGPIGLFPGVGIPLFGVAPGLLNAGAVVPPSVNVAPVPNTEPIPPAFTAPAFTAPLTPSTPVTAAAGPASVPAAVTASPSPAAAPRHHVARHANHITAPKRGSDGATRLTFVVPPNVFVFGQPIALTATVSAVDAGSETPTGTVTFKDDGRILGTARVDPAGRATLSGVQLERGRHTLSALFEGDDDFTGVRETRTAWAGAEA